METKELKLAKESLKDEKTKSISLAKMAEMVEQNGKKGTIFYLDRENSDKDLKKMESFFKSKKRSILLRELKYAMDPKDYIYEVHIL